MAKQYGRTIHTVTGFNRHKEHLVIPVGTIIEFDKPVVYKGELFCHATLRRHGDDWMMSIPVAYVEVPKKILWGPLNV